MLFIRLPKYNQCSNLKGGCHEPVNDQLVVGIAVVLCIAVFAATRYRREHKDESVVRWLDTHSIREWMRHKH